MCAKNKRLQVEIPALHMFHFALEITVIVKLMHIVPMYIFDPFTLYMYTHKQNINVLKFLTFYINGIIKIVSTLSMVYKTYKCVHVNIYCTLNFLYNIPLC